MIKSLKYLSKICICASLGLPLLSQADSDPCSQLSLLPSTTATTATTASEATTEASTLINTCLIDGGSALGNSLQSSAAPTINNLTSPIASGAINVNTPAQSIQPIQLAPTNKTKPSTKTNTGIFNY